jgi:UDP-glucose 4-epimerase
VERVTRRPVPWRVGPRRAGDPPRLVAGAEKARKQLGFQPAQSGIDDIVETAVRWRVDHPRGYGVRS